MREFNGSSLHGEGAGCEMWLQTQVRYISRVFYQGQAPPATAGLSKRPMSRRKGKDVRKRGKILRVCKAQGRRQPKSKRGQSHGGGGLLQVRDSRLLLYARGTVFQRKGSTNPSPLNFRDRPHLSLLALCFCNATPPLNPFRRKGTKPCPRG